ncbi:MAG: hypothetical protein NWR51_15555 [Akkermansiaceae bacterium]|nr:hypothetical protein [Akkermansiaceae bacterium]
MENESGGSLRISGMGYQLAELHEGFDREDELWLHPKGGIRGITVRNEGGETSLSLPTGCSDMDYAFAWELMRMGVAHGAVATDEEERDLDLTDAQIHEVTQIHQDFEWSALIASVNKNEGITLPVGGMIHLQITPEDAVEGAVALKGKLSARMANYEDAFVASLMMTSKDGKEYIVSNYAQIPSLISAQATLISTQGQNGAVVDEPIPASHFFACLGERVEDLGVLKYVPAIDFSLETELVDSLKAMPEEEAGLTGEDWATLAKAPCLVFILVAAADGKVDAKEIKAFGSILENHESLPSSILSKILGIAQQNFESFIQEIVADGRSPQDQLLGLADLLKSGKIPKEDAVVVAKGLLLLGKAIASASGGFLGFGSKISKEEKQALAVLELILVVGLLG